MIQEVKDYLTPQNRERHTTIKLIDSITWAHDTLLPHLNIPTKLNRVAIHPTCSIRHLELTHTLETIADQIADDVVVPTTATCCAFAGDRGFLHPELTESATHQQTHELHGQNFDAYLCGNRTCEIGMQHATGQPYQSIILTLEQLTRQQHQ